MTGDFDARDSAISVGRHILATYRVMETGQGAQLVAKQMFDEVRTEICQLSAEQRKQVYDQFRNQDVQAKLVRTIGAGTPNGFSLDTAPDGRGNTDILLKHQDSIDLTLPIRCL